MFPLPSTHLAFIHIKPLDVETSSPIQTLLPSFINYVTLGKLLYLSEIQFSYLQIQSIKYEISKR